MLFVRPGGAFDENTVVAHCLPYYSRKSRHSCLNNVLLMSYWSGKFLICFQLYWPKSYDISQLHTISKPAELAYCAVSVVLRFEMLLLCERLSREIINEMKRLPLRKPRTHWSYYEWLLCIWVAVTQGKRTTLHWCFLHGAWTGASRVINSHPAWQSEITAILNLSRWRIKRDCIK